MTAPHPGTPAEAAATTPGQAAYNARHLAVYGVAAPDWAWGHLAAKERTGMEAAAQAAITAGTGKILAEAARYKAERDEARDRLAADCGCGRGLADCARDAARDRDIHARRLDEKRQELSRVTGEFATHVRKCGPGAIEELEAGNARLAGELAEVRERLRAWKLSAAGDESELQHIHETLESAYGREDLGEETAVVVEAMAAEWKRYRKALEEIATLNHDEDTTRIATAALGDGG